MVLRRATRRMGGPFRHGADSVANGSGCHTAARRGSSRIAHDASRSWFETQECTVVFVGEQVQEPVGPFANFPDALPELRQHRLAPELLCLLIEHDALQVARARYSTLAQGPHEDVALPRGNASPV